MSASEKLKALEAGITAGEWVANERYSSSLTVGGEFKFSGRMRTEADARFCAALANALPQIVAVIEAAEKHIKAEKYVPGSEVRLRAALSALEEELS